MLEYYLRLKAFANSEEGQTVVEYCIMIGVVGLAIIVLSPSITSAVASFFGRVSTSLGSVGT